MLAVGRGGGRQHDGCAVQRDGFGSVKIDHSACGQRQIFCPCIDSRSDDQIDGRCRRDGGIAPHGYSISRGQNDGPARQRHRCAREIELAARAIIACEQAQISRACIDVRANRQIIRRAHNHYARPRCRSSRAAGQRDALRHPDRDPAA